MAQMKPDFLITKYRSILKATFVVEVVTYIVSLTDTLIAGNLVSSEAMAAVGLVAPLSLAAAAVTSVINTGTVIHYSQCIGSFRKERAHAFFSLGILLSLVAGILMTVLLYLARDTFIDRLELSHSMARDVRGYYDIILWFFLMEPLNCLLDNIVTADGGEKLSAVSNVTQIASNIALSIIFSMKWGVEGIALASVLCKLVAVLILCGWFFYPKNGLRFFLHWDGDDCRKIFQSGAVKASIFAVPAVVTVAVNAFAAARFDEETLVVLVVVEKVLAASTMFMGMAMALQPVIGTLRGEKNSKAIRFVMRTALHDILLAGVVISTLATVFAPLLTQAFGVNAGDAYIPCVEAVRIAAATLFCQAVLSLFFIYYILLDKGTLAFVICLSKEALCPLAVIFTAVTFLEDRSGLWIGFSLAAVISLLLCTVMVRCRYGKEKFPFLLDGENEEDTYIYDFDLNIENILDTCHAVEKVLAERRYPMRIQNRSCLVVEEILMAIMEKNPDASQTLKTECTMILAQREIRLIFRDSGIIFNFVDEDTMPETFRQFFISCIMERMESKVYVTTTGYNRHIVVIPVD